MPTKNLNLNCASADFSRNGRVCSRHHRRSEGRTAVFGMRANSERGGADS